MEFVCGRAAAAIAPVYPFFVSAAQPTSKEALLPAQPNMAFALRSRHICCIKTQFV
jgi:hypothetical protein